MNFNIDKWRHNPAANFGKPYQICSKTVMDTISDAGIYFDEDGISNYYHDYNVKAAIKLPSASQAQDQLNNIIHQIREAGKGKRYDCITGISGGVDSSYLVYMAKEWGLRPLVVHFDNGWNSEISVKNIENIISKTGFDLYTLVVNWEEFKDIQLSYFKANVVDIEAITDHAISATLYKLARKENVKYILSGNNHTTEGILPAYWTFNKGDSRNIKAIHRQFGKGPIKTFPFASLKARKIFSDIYGIKVVEPLNLVRYDKGAVKKIISEKMEWKDYGGKHYESIFTRFYQGYILPNKFGIDKRRAHLSSLICSGQMNREDALFELSKPIYNDEQLKIDKEFILKKLDFSVSDFDKYMNSPRVEHTQYDYERGFFNNYPVFKRFRRVLGR